jgi:hypothetical protein
MIIGENRDERIRQELYSGSYVLAITSLLNLWINCEKWTLWKKKILIVLMYCLFLYFISAFKVIL